MAKDWGLAPALLINNFIIFLMGIGFVALVYFFPEKFPEIFRIRAGAGRGFRFWYLTPAVCGFLIVTLIPWAMEQMGAVKVFLALIAIQIVASMLWDYFIEAIPLNRFRLAGAALAVIGAYITTLKR